MYGYSITAQDKASYNMRKNNNNLCLQELCLAHHLYLSDYLWLLFLVSLCRLLTAMSDMLPHLNMCCQSGNCTLEETQKHRSSVLTH